MRAGAAPKEPPRSLTIEAQPTWGPDAARVSLRKVRCEGRRSGSQLLYHTQGTRPVSTVRRRMVFGCSTRTRSGAWRGQMLLPRQQEVVP